MNTENTPFKTQKTVRILKEADSCIMEWAQKAYELLRRAVILLICAIVIGVLFNIAGARQVNYVLGPLAVLLTIAVAFTPSIVVRLLGMSFFIGIPADGDAVAFVEKILKKFTKLTLRIAWGVAAVFGLLCLDFQGVAWLFFVVVTVGIIMILADANTETDKKPLWRRAATAFITLAVALLLFNSFVNEYGSRLMSWSGVDIAGLLNHSAEQKKSYEAMRAYNERKNRACIKKFIDPATGKPFATVDAFTEFMATTAQFDNHAMEECLSQLNQGSTRLMNKNQLVGKVVKSAKIRAPWSGPELFYSVTYAPKDHPVGGMVVEVPEGDTKPYTIQCSGQYTQKFAGDGKTIAIGCSGYSGAILDAASIQIMPLPNTRFYGTALVNDNMVHSDKYIGRSVLVNINVPAEERNYVHTRGSITFNFFR